MTAYPTNAKADQPWSVMTIYYATDRMAAGTVDGHPEYKSSRAPQKQYLRYGYLDVSIPASHKRGELKSDPYLYRLFHLHNPSRYIEIQSGKEILEAELVSSLSAADSKSILLFVHGFNNTFDEAAERTAQIGYDTNFPGTLMFFSWPSLGEAEAYGYDRNNELWASMDLAHLLEVIDSTNGAGNLTILAHSMGNQMLADALMQLHQRNPSLVTRVGHIIMAAPDVDAETFARLYASIFQSAPSTTIYVSSTDKALTASEVIQGQHRLGDARSGPLVFPPMDTVDATAVSTSFTGHAYLSDSSDVLGDMALVITTGMPAAKRPHMSAAKNTDQQPYWRLVAGSPP